MSGGWGSHLPTIQLRMEMVKSSHPSQRQVWPNPPSWHDDDHDTHVLSSLLHFHLGSLTLGREIPEDLEVKHAQAMVREGRTWGGGYLQVN